MSPGAGRPAFKSQAEEHTYIVLFSDVLQGVESTTGWHRLSF